MKSKTISFNPKFSYDKGTVFESTLEEYFNTTRSPEMKQLIAKIRATADEKERRKLKLPLPIRCPHYFSFRNNHRAQDDILPEEFTFQTCVDVDDMSQVEGALTRAYLLNKEEGPWQGKLLHAEYSASHKLHLDIRMPIGMTIEETQVAYCNALEIAFDPNCITPERAIYITDEESQLYTSPEWQSRLSDEEIALRRKAFEERGLDIDGRGHESEQEDTTEAEAAENGEAKQYPDKYEEIPYTLLIETLTDQMGGAPAHGSRNDFIFRMCCHLRHVCNNDPAWIRQILPDFGEDHQRVTDTIKSACKRSQKSAMSALMRTVLDLCRRQILIESGEDKKLLIQEPQMPQHLPGFIKLITSKVPVKYRPAVAASIFPALGTRLGGVKAEYENRALFECNFMSALIAPMASGKSCIKSPIEACLHDLEERDNQSREREQEWKDAINSRSTDSEKPVRPKDLCHQVIDSDMTNAAFVQLLIDAERAGDKGLYTKMDEIEGLYRVGNGKRQTTDEILKRNFDNDLYGQERAGAMSVSGRAHLRWNFNASTTPEKAIRFFKGNVTDGTLSRFDVCTIVDDNDDEIPVYSRYDDNFLVKVSAYMSHLDEANGIIVCSQAKNLAKDLTKIAVDRAAMLDFDGYKRLARRSIVITFCKAIVLYIINGHKWSKEIENFCRWSFNYDMWCKMRFFFDDINKDIESEEKAMKRGRPNLLNLMADEFTRDDARSMRIRQGLSPDPGNMIAKWKERKFITYDENSKTYHKSPEFLAQNAA